MSLQQVESDDRIKVGIADRQLSTNGELLTTSGVGSCLGIGILDEREGIGGLVHVMLPKADESVDNESKYADTGIERLVHELEKAGGERSNLVAKMAGGSDMLSFESNSESIGTRNIDVARTKLEDLEIPLDGEDVGGNHGRSIEFHPPSGSFLVKSAKQENRSL